MKVPVFQTSWGRLRWHTSWNKSFIYSHFHFCSINLDSLLHNKKRISFLSWTPPQYILKSSSTVLLIYPGKQALTQSLKLSWRRSVPFRNQPINLLYESMDWFLYDRDLRHESIKKQNGSDAIRSYLWSFPILCYYLSFPEVDNFILKLSGVWSNTCSRPTITRKNNIVIVDF